jgi:ATP-dependent protease HslVU (ClpYQ) peptidase subunit
MTVIAYRDGVIAADSRVTVEGKESGIRFFDSSIKLFRKDGCIIATAGASAPGIVFVRWYGTRPKKPPEAITDAKVDWTCLVLDKTGLWEWDSSLEPEQVLEPFYAIGTGCKAALGAMYMHATAVEAVQIACLIDPNCGGKVQTMRLDNP